MGESPTSEGSTQLGTPNSAPRPYHQQGGIVGTPTVRGYCCWTPGPNTTSKQESNVPSCRSSLPEAGEGGPVALSLGAGALGKTLPVSDLMTSQEVTTTLVSGHA